MRCLKMLISASQLVASMLARGHWRRRCLCTPTGACLHPAWLFEARRARRLASPASEASMLARTGGAAVSRPLQTTLLVTARSQNELKSTNRARASDHGSVSASAWA